MNTNAMMRAAFAALVLTTLGLAACSGPTLNGRSDAAQLLPGGQVAGQQVRMTIPPTASVGVSSAAAATARACSVRLGSWKQFQLFVLIA